MGIRKIYSWGVLGTLLLLTACKTTPMYQEGDVHLQDVCQNGEFNACFEKLEKVCKNAFKGWVINTSDFVVEDNLIHLVCRPEVKPKQTAKKEAADAQAKKIKSQDKTSLTAPQKSSANHTQTDSKQH